MLIEPLITVKRKYRGTWVISSALKRIVLVIQGYIDMVMDCISCRTHAAKHLKKIPMT